MRELGRLGSKLKVEIKSHDFSRAHGEMLNVLCHVILYLFIVPIYFIVTFPFDFNISLKIMIINKIKQ